jgi:hypothetical protein
MSEIMEVCSEYSNKHYLSLGYFHLREREREETDVINHTSNLNFLNSPQNIFTATYHSKSTL